VSFRSLLRHRLVAVRRTLSDDPADRDDYGQPTVTGTATIPFRGRVSPKSVRETALVSQAGAQIGDHTIFAEPFDLAGSDYIAFADPADPTQEDPGDDRRYEVTGIRDAAGQSHHLEIDARLVTSEGRA
jgi:hypothetical protein